MLQKNNKKIIQGWAFYDWANSVYSLVITTTVFPIYYNSVTSGSGSDMVDFLGYSIRNTVLYEFSLSFSFLLVAGLAPLLSGIADYGGKRKFFMKMFTYIGSTSCIMLYFFTATSDVAYGILFSSLASIGFAGSLVFYNSYLPVIVSPDLFDKVSAKGFSMGYVGSVILMVIILIFINYSEPVFGITDASLPPRISFVLVGLWWVGFAQISFNRLPENEGHYSKDGGNILQKGYKEIIKIWQEIKSLGDLKKFVISYFFYNTGVQTTIYVASLFGATVLGLPTDLLILTILIIQIVAIGGATFFAYVSGLKGNRFSLIIMILLWIVVCISAYFISTTTEFFILAFLVGLVLGGIQSLSRATYSKFIPSSTKDHTSFFSFYDVTEKLSLVMGTFAYAIIDHFTGSMRSSSMAMASFFIVGLLILLSVKIPRTSTSVPQSTL